MSTTLYVVHFGGDWIKVGKSSRPSARMNAYIGIANVANMYVSERLDDVAAQLAENLLIEELRASFSTWFGREWFYCPLSIALGEMRSIAAYYAQWRMLEALPPKDWPDRWNVDAHGRKLK